MRLSIQQYALALRELLQEGGKEKALSNFKAYLTKRGEGAKFIQVLEEAIRQVEVAENIEKLVVFTKYAVTTKERGTLEKKIATLYPGKKLDLTYVLDESLIGGFRVQGQNTSYDHTIAHSLNQFSQTLKS
ncbi:MAG: F0F1 ATP synthase subunit delta [Patescibacteria group bacterium]